MLIEIRSLLHQFETCEATRHCLPDELATDHDCLNLLILISKFMLNDYISDMYTPACNLT